MKKREQQFKELSDKYSSEHKLRIKTEKQRDKLAEKLVINEPYILYVCDYSILQQNTEEDLDEHKEHVT